MFWLEVEVTINGTFCGSGVVAGCGAATRVGVGGLFGSGVGVGPRGGRCSPSGATTGVGRDSEVARGTAGATEQPLTKTANATSRPTRRCRFNVNLL